MGRRTFLFLPAHNRDVRNITKIKKRDRKRLSNAMSNFGSHVTGTGDGCTLRARKGGPLINENGCICYALQLRPRKPRRCVSLPEFCKMLLRYIKYTQEAQTDETAPRNSKVQKVEEKEMSSTSIDMSRRPRDYE